MSTVPGRRAMILRRQRRRTVALIRHARRHSRFFQRGYADQPAEPVLVDLPVTRKRELMDRFDEWVTEPSLRYAELTGFVADPARTGERYAGRYLVYTTSGSTGVPGLLVQDPRAQRVYGWLAATRLAPAFLGATGLAAAGRIRRAAGLWALGGHFAGAATAGRLAAGGPFAEHRMRAFDVLAPVDETVAGLNAYQPDLLMGYATALSVLAAEQRAGRLRIRPVLVVTVSESLPRYERDRIGTSFRAPVRDLYGASEFIPLGVECRYHWLHVNDDWAVLEPVDSRYQPVPPGTASATVLLTNLANRVQPLIRYDLGDSVTVRPEPCPCGRPLTAIRVQGRHDDVLRLPGTAGDVAIVPLAVETVLERCPGLAAFQLVQTGPTALRLRVATDPAAEAPAARDVTRTAAVHALRDWLAGQGCAGVTVESDDQAPVRDPRTGKTRQVLRAPA